MNLGGMGGFAASAMSGYKDGVRFAEERADREEARAARRSNLRMQEEQHGARMQEVEAQQKKRAREEQAQAELSGLWSQFYGEREVDGEHVVAEDGKRVRLKVKKTVEPMSDPANDLSYMRARLAVLSKYRDVNPEELKSSFEFVENARKTEAGQVLSRVLSGDPEAVRKFAQQRGLDPGKATLRVDPREGVAEVVSGGQRVDLLRALALEASAEQYRAVMASMQGGNLLKAGALKNEETQADIALKRSQAAEVGERRKGLAADRTSRELKEQIGVVAQPDPTSVDGKVKDPLQAAFLQARAAQLMREGKAKNSVQAVPIASQEWIAVGRNVDQWMSGVRALPKSELQTRFGTTNLNQIRSNKIQRELQKLSGFAASQEQ